MEELLLLLAVLAAKRFKTGRAVNPTPEEFAGHLVAPGPLELPKVAPAPPPTMADQTIAPRPLAKWEGRQLTEAETLQLSAELQSMFPPDEALSFDATVLALVGLRKIQLHRFYLAGPLPIINKQYVAGREPGYPPKYIAASNPADWRVQATALAAWSDFLNGSQYEQTMYPRFVPGIIKFDKTEFWKTVDRFVISAALASVAAISGGVFVQGVLLAPEVSSIALSSSITQAAGLASQVYGKVQDLWTSGKSIQVQLEVAADSFFALKASEAKTGYDI